MLEDGISIGKKLVSKKFLKVTIPSTSMAGPRDFHHIASSPNHHSTASVLHVRVSKRCEGGFVSEQDIFPPIHCPLWTLHHFMQCSTSMRERNVMAVK